VIAAAHAVGIRVNQIFAFGDAVDADIQKAADRDSEEENKWEGCECFDCHECESSISYFLCMVGGTNAAVQYLGMSPSLGCGDRLTAKYWT
jgi:hypothetical protein